MQLPEELQSAIASVVQLPQYRTDVYVAKKISDRYRSDVRNSHAPMVHSDTEIAAYIGARMPATYVAIHTVLSHLQRRRPDFCPRTVSDAGAGPGTGLWAALDIWPGLQRMQAIERVSGMVDIGKLLAEQSSSDALQSALWQHADLRTTVPAAADLVLCAYVLNEMNEEEVAALTMKLWERTKEVLVLIEPGTTAGWARLMHVRAELIAAGAYLVAPCPHTHPCPIEKPDWCHFMGRVERSHLHRQLKTGELSYEDEKFSYLCFSKRPGSMALGRIRRRPVYHSGYVVLPLCSREGLVEKTVTRSQKQDYRLARKAELGDEWPLQP